MLDHAALVIVLCGVKTLLHSGGGFVRPGHLDGDRVLQIAAGQALDLRRERGREQQSRALLGQIAQDALQVRQKANVQHAVGFVQHHILDLVEHRIFGLDVVE